MAACAQIVLRDMWMAGWLSVYNGSSRRAPAREAIFVDNVE